MAKKTLSRVNLEQRFLAGSRLERLSRALAHRPRCIFIGLLTDLWAESQTEERTDATAEEICAWSRLYQLADWLDGTDLLPIQDEEWVQALVKTEFLAPLPDGRYRIRGNEEQIEGLKAFREKGGDGAKKGGESRAADADRDEHGRFKPKPPAERQPPGPAESTPAPAGTSYPAAPASSHIISSHSISSQEEEEERPPESAAPPPTEKAASPNKARLADLGLGDFLEQRRFGREAEEETPDSLVGTWFSTYGFEFVRENLPRARVAWETAPNRRSDFAIASKGEVGSFVRKWFENAVKDLVKQGEPRAGPGSAPPPTAAAGPAPPARKCEIEGMAPAGFPMCVEHSKPRDSNCALYRNWEASRSQAPPPVNGVAVNGAKTEGIHGH